ncbi:MAG: hypothetical protein AAB382_03815, partial [Chloroflexota bacterium]
VARLSPNPILGPLSGGVPVVLYLAGRGLEEDFKEFASEIQEDGLQRLATIPDQDTPIVLVFGDPEAMEEQTINAPTPVAAATAPLPGTGVQLPAPAPQAQVNAPTRPEVQTRHVASLPPPTPQPIAEVTTPPPAPEPAPVTVQPELQPAPVAPAQPEVAQPELAPTLVSEPAPIPIPTPTPTLEAVVTQPPTALALGSDYYVLRTPDISGTTVVVWHARRLTAAPDAGEYEILQPTAATYERLITDARSNVRYTDDQPGEMAAIRIALHGSEPDLERAVRAVRRIGPRAPKLYYPNPAVAESAWSPDFPCCAVEWVSGTSVTESPVFSEATGLEICAQIVELLATARQAAPDVVLTDSLEPSNVIISYDERGAMNVRLVDWNVYASQESDARHRMVRRLGELMADVFADIRTGADVESLGVGQPGDATVLAWDQLSHGARTLVRRALRGEFEGDVDTVIGELSKIVGEQRTRWADNDPSWQARLVDSGPDRLNWLDIAAVKQGGLSDEARTRLADARKNEITDVVAISTADRKYLEAVLDLRVAVRRHPEESFFRWALLANTVGMIGPEGAFQRLRLDEALTLMSIGEYAPARRTLDHGVAFFDEVQFDPEKRERARDYVSALSMCAQSLALADSGAVAVNENWNVEEAESKLALAEDRASRYERMAAGLLHGRDTAVQQKLSALRQAIADFYARHGRYDPYAAKRETAEQARRANFSRLVERGRTLAAPDKPDRWSTALLLFDRAASEHPDLWIEEHDAERGALLDKMSRRRLAEGKQALARADWGGAAAALAAAMLNPATSGEAARLQSALWAYQRGELELKRGELSAALASFSFAGENSEEIRPAAEAQAQAVREKGGAPGGDALSRELERRFAEQQDALKGVVQGAALATQEQAHGKQAAALKQAQEEGAAKQAASIRRLLDEQAASLQASLTQFQRELVGQIEAASKKSQDEQTVQLRALLMKLYDEHAEGQQLAMKDAQSELSARLKELQSAPPEWFAKAQKDQRKAQEDQEAKVQATLKSLEDLAAWLRTSSAQKQETQPKESAPVDASIEATVKELGFKVDGNATTLKTLAGRLGVLTASNVLLMLVALALATGAGVYAFWFGPRFGAVAIATAAPVPAVTEAVAVQRTAVPPTAAVPSSDVTLSCADDDQVRSYYDCTVTNTTHEPQSFTLLISAEDDQANGFFYSVRKGSDSVIGVLDSSLSPGSAKFPIGNYAAGESKQLRISLSCTAAGGCKSTTFTFSVLADKAGSDSGPGNRVQVTTFYSPP